MANGAEHRLLTVASRSSVELPLSAVLADGAIEVYPQVESKGLLFLQFQGGRVIITAGKYIGLIPLTPNISVEVRPKLPVSNLAHILDHARASLGSVALDRVYELGGDQGSTILEFLLSNLLSALREVQARGYLKTYVRRSEAGLPRGRILVGQTVKSLWSRGERHRVATEAFEQTVDVSPNRAIKQALECAMVALRRAMPESPVLKRANRFFVEFPRTVTNFRNSDLVACAELLRSRSLPASRDYYYRPLEIATLILSRASVSLEHTGGNVELETFVLDFEDVFERYLRRTLQLRAPDPFVVKDGNGDGARPLYDDRPEPPAHPDIVVKHAQWPPLIVDAKYKNKPDRADVNQVVTYAACYRTNTVILAYPAKGPTQTGMKLRGTINGVRVFGYGFDLAAENLLDEEEKFANAITGVVPAPAVEEMAA
ncbi:hypothetical protein [Sphingopyxis sp.]|uniref:McrC family protein n=1 Tax=Sphingopyxis sp. TaxID=1908224 RepID=UPI0026294781|nr:hypothetical protein [Sphingopyxis sp.]MCW0196819.1 McrC family protein [Sphingopyxis sp.]